MQSQHELPKNKEEKSAVAYFFWGGYPPLDLGQDCLDDDPEWGNFSEKSFCGNSSVFGVIVLLE